MYGTTVTHARTPQTDEGVTSSQYCTNDNTLLIAGLNGISDLMYTVDLMELVRYTFNFVIVASVNSNFADGPPGQSLSFTTPATSTEKSMYWSYIIIVQVCNILYRQACSWT